MFPARVSTRNPASSNEQLNSGKPQGEQTARHCGATDGQEVTVLRRYERRGRIATFSSDGARIVIAFADRAARISDTTTGMEITRIALDAAV
jgi:hypothetical protein